MATTDNSSKVVNLVLLTNHFPYGKGEEFLQNEYPFYSNRIDNVILISKNTTDPLRAGMSKSKSYRVGAKGSFGEYFIVCLQFVRKFFKVMPLITDELEFIVTRKFSLSVVRKMFHDLFKSLSKGYYVEQILRHEKLEGRIILYSYWLDSTALSLIFVNPKSDTVTRISRGHGGDVYAFRHPHNYLSFRRSLTRNLDKIFTISENGNAFLRTFTGLQETNKIVTSRLGTKGVARKVIKLARPFHVVSCSYMLPVKRIHLIIEALARTTLDIRWTHIGGGPLKNDLQKLAASSIAVRSNVTYEFAGNMTNESLMRFYTETDVHLFINCSETEGIPVTMMEAQSFGIPVVAPEVGGIPEIISEETGLLFKKDASPEMIAAAMESILTLSESAYERLQEKSFENWRSRYNADKNFPTFVDQILSIQK